MIEINNIFDERKKEIEFYYSILLEMDNDNRDVINTIDNQQLFRIMKSNFILMLYNMVEATVTTGMVEIFDQVKSDACTYSTVIEEVKTIWRDYQVKQVYTQSAVLKTYTGKVKEIVEHITADTPLVFAKEMLNINGNLNAGRITNICDSYKIRYHVSDDKTYLEKVRLKRNSLAHGEESFSQCARDLTLSDLEDIKDTIISFLNGIITGMEHYCDDKLYLLSNDVN